MFHCFGCLPDCEIVDDEPASGAFHDASGRSRVMETNAHARVRVFELLSHPIERRSSQISLLVSSTQR